jgi:hypothetical protein
MRYVVTFRMQALISLVVMANACVGKPQQLSLPAEQAVDSVSVRLFGEFLDEANTPAFLLRSSDVKTLLRVLTSHPQSSSNAAGFGSPIIMLSITTPTGSTSIDIPWSGKNRLYFIVDGVACEREGQYVIQDPITEKATAFPPDESLLLYRFLKQCAPAL